MTDILKRHDGVRASFDNRWLTLFALDEHAITRWHYAGKLQWSEAGFAEPPESWMKVAG